MEILNIAASALASAGQAARIHAYNIVNANSVSTNNALGTSTPFKPQAPAFSPIVNGGGVAVFTQQIDQPVNLITETLGLITASHQYKAAADLLRRADEMHATLLRTFA